MPIEITPAGPENIPDTGFPEGHVSAANNPAEPPLQHRPHAFALMHGDEGAKIAYGQFMWRIDVIELAFCDAGSGVSNPLPAPGSNIICGAAGQPRVIKGLEAEIPKIKQHDGTVMDPKIPNTYYELDAYGDVYLYWFVDTDHSDFITKCWVQAGDVATADLDALAVANTTHDRINTSGDSQNTYYRVKLGTVNDGALVQQDISSDVYWSTSILTRSLYS